MQRLALLTACLAVGAAAPARADLVLQRQPGISRAALHERAGVRPTGAVPGLPRVDVVVAGDGRRRRALTALREDPAVVWAEPVRERRVQADTTPWGIAKVSAPAAWPTTRGAGATVAVVDTGAELTHPDLAARLTGNPGERGSGREGNGLDDDGNGLVDDWRGWDFNADDNLPADGNGHGTHVAGTVLAADDGAGVVGVAPQAQLLVLQALGANGSGWSTDVAAAFDYAGDLGVPVVNASLGSESPTMVERAAIAAHPETLYVVAAGNGGSDGVGDDNDGAAPDYPCSYPEPNVVCVGATRSDDTMASFSNFGATTVDLFAPGQSIASAYLGGSYGAMSGTSMATPHVAGAAALVAAARPAWGAAQRKQALLASADPVAGLTGKSVSGGRLDAAAAVAWASADEPEPGPDPEPTPDPDSAPEPQPEPGPSPDPEPAPAPWTDPAPVPAPLPAPSDPAAGGPAAGDPVITRLRVRGRVRACRSACRARTSALRFTASHVGGALLTVERRRCGRCRYVVVSRTARAVTAGRQRLPLSTLRLRRGSWRITLGDARIAFRVL
jgi:subtilisin family serine protease